MELKVPRLLSPRALSGDPSFTIWRRMGGLVDPMLPEVLKGPNNALCLGAFVVPRFEL